MISRALWRASACAVFGLALGACQSFDVEDHQFAIIAAPMVADGVGFVTRPSAFFFEGVGIRLATTQVGNQGCVAQDIDDPAPDTFNDIDAGDGITVSAGEGETEDEGILTPSAVGARILYQLPSGESIAVTPGDQVTVQIPGAEGGFPARLVVAQTVADFTPDPVTVPASTVGEVTVTWDPPSPISGTAMFYSFRWATEGETLDEEVACVFADDGSGVIDVALLQAFREANVREIHAQRALITVDRIGNAITHFTSSLLRTVPIAGE